MFLDKFDIFVFRHRASRRNVKSMLTIENRGAGRTSTLADIVCTLCTSRYDDVCIGLVDQVLFYLSLSLCPAPFLSHIHDVIATPTTVTRSHFDPRRSISVFHPLLLCFPRSLLLLLLFPFSSLSLTLSPSLSQKESRIWQGSIHSCPYSHDPAISTAPARFNRAHMDRRIRTQRLRESKRERERGKRRVCTKKRGRDRRGKRNERCSSDEERK